MRNRISILIGGEAGYGIMTSGEVLARAFAREGYHVFATSEYPSLIRGGHNTLKICLGVEEIFSHWRDTDILVALDARTIHEHSGELSERGVVLYDGEMVKLDFEDINLISLPLKRLASKIGGEIMRNTVALGGVVALMNFKLDLLLKTLEDHLREKSETIKEQNLSAVQAGFDFVRENYSDFIISDFSKPLKSDERMLLTGNDAICLGALKAGCKFLSAYPMTPASSILHFMAANEREFKIIAKQTEDELAAINMAIGASFAGVRSMTSTSGGGFSLMVEALGLAAMSETPLVLIECQRPGPSTGLATRTEQGDLQFVLNASQGDFLRIVAAPGDVRECFLVTHNAFNLAERYQIPVIVLSDKFLSESLKTTSPFETKDLRIDRGSVLSDEGLDYRRYLITQNGVSPRSFPGEKGGIHVTSGDEHDESGNSEEKPEIRKEMMDKRFRKLEKLTREIPKPTIYGKRDASITLIGWGSTKGPVLETLRLFEEKDMDVNFLHFVYLNPFPKGISKILKSLNLLIGIEGNQTGQFSRLIREKTGKEMDHTILKYDGRPFIPSFILSEAEKVIRW